MEEKEKEKGMWPVVHGNHLKDATSYIVEDKLRKCH